MKPEIRFYGRIIKGKKIYYNPELHEQRIIELEGNEFEETFKKKHKKPSIDTHGYYRGGILPTCWQHEIFRHFDSSDDIHNDHFAHLYLSYSQKVIVGNENWLVKKQRSTASLTQEEMNEFIERVIAWCNTNNIFPLSPEEYKVTYYRTIKKQKDGNNNTTNI